MAAIFPSLLFNLVNSDDGIHGTNQSFIKQLQNVGSFNAKKTGKGSLFTCRVNDDKKRG